MKMFVFSTSHQTHTTKQSC